MPASFPGEIKVFSTKTEIDDVEAAHVNELQDEITAIETELFDPEDGAWTAVPFNAADYTGNVGMLWTVIEANVIDFRYKVEKKTMSVSFYGQNMTIGGTPSTILSLRIPGGHLAVGIGTFVFAGGISTGSIFGTGNAASNVLQFYRDHQLNSAWTATTNFDLQFSAVFEIA